MSLSNDLAQELWFNYQKIIRSVKERRLNQWRSLPSYFHTLAAEKPNSVLLQTGRFDESDYQSLLFVEPIEIIEARHIDEIPIVFDRINDALKQGNHVAGFLGYEAGYHFQDLPKLFCAGDLPLAWFGVYQEPLVFDHRTESLKDDVDDDFPDRLLALPEALATNVSLTISESEYVERIHRIKSYLTAGDTYQVNFTDRVELPISFDPILIFRALLRSQPVAYSAFLNLRDHQIVSFSPELFFRVAHGRITTRPMKGTMQRGRDVREDEAASTRLHNDEKNRSEHVMIVDLLRNDLGRICTMGSIEVEDLFTVEPYRTLLQMTSTVSGRLREEVDFYDIFKSLFPCGSITGAPKIRTMEIIHELEQSNREIYTGAIGFIAPHGSSVFNVAIRTLSLRDGSARMGVGGGIVADSEPLEEHQECLLKASFLTRPSIDFQLIETMLWTNEIVHLDFHLERLQNSALYFQFPFNREVIVSKLLSSCSDFARNERYRIRLLVSESGAIKIETTKIQLAEHPWRVCIVDTPASSTDPFLRHKTTHRAVYETALATAQKRGFDEVLFINEHGEVTEGAVSNIFILHQQQLLTPPLTSGLLPGVFRRHLLETHSEAREAVLTIEDLKMADDIYMCNAVRGLCPVQSIDVSGQRFSPRKYTSPIETSRVT